MNKVRIFPIFVPHAGCPQACLFCAQQTSTGAGTVPDPEEVRSWLNEALPAAGTGEIAFYGGSFSALPQWRQAAYLATAGSFVEQGRAAGIRVSTRPDALSCSQVAGLAAGGVTTVEIGCQSFDDAVLSASRRGHAAEAIGPAVKGCRAARLRIGLQLMPGLPGACPGEAERSMREALALQPDFVRIYPALVLEGTGLAELWRQGRYVPLSLQQAVALVARLLLLCREAAIPVIRVGLQQQAGLAESVLAGPYHPAFGQLVKARLWRWALEAVAEGHGVVSVHPSDLSDARGHGRENLLWLQKNALVSAIRADHRVCRGSLDYGGKRFLMQDSIPRGGRP